MEEELEDEPTTCAVCEERASNKCSVCKAVAYCSKDHQKLHWKSHRSSCRPFEIKSSPELGRYLVSTKDVAGESCLLVEAALVVGPRLGGSHPLCLGCLAFLGPHCFPCPACLWPMCSRRCPGLADPRAHLLECRVLATNLHPTKAGRLNYDAITPLRCLLLQKSNPRKWQEVMSLESHMEDRGEDTDVYRDLQTMVEYLMNNFLCNLTEDVLPNVSAEVIHQLCGILDVNGLEIPIGPEEVIALYPTASLMEHSCLPNTKHSFHVDDFKIRIFSSCDIKSGENVSTMYTHALWGTMARRAHLKDTKYFNCRCQRCSDPTELGTNFSTLRCIGTQGNIEEACGEGVLPLDPLDENSDWKCQVCPLTLTADHVSDLLTRIGAQIDEAMESPEIDNLESLIENLEKFVHKNHYQCYMAKHSLVQLYGHENGYKHEELTIERLNKKIDMCRDLLDVTLKLDPYNNRLTMYSSVLYYELHSALMEKSHRSDKLEEKEGIWREVKELLEKSAGILAEEVSSPAGASLLTLVNHSLNTVTKMLDSSCRVVELD